MRGGYPETPWRLPTAPPGGLLAKLSSSAGRLIQGNEAHRRCSLFSCEFPPHLLCVAKPIQNRHANMVQMAVINNNNGSLVNNGKQPGLVKNKSSNSIGSNGNGMVKAAANGGGGEGGKRGGGEGSAPRKLTKNEKRRQKNKQKKAQASEGAVVEKSMAEANGVAVASWPPPAAKGEASDVQVRLVEHLHGYDRFIGRFCFARAAPYVGYAYWTSSCWISACMM